MKNYFKGTVTYTEEGADKATTVNFLVDALTFTEAEANLTQFMVEFEDQQDHLIKTLTRVSYDDVLFLKDMEEFNWYIATVKMALDGDKETGFKYLIAGTDSKDAMSQMYDWLKDSEGDWRVPKMVEEPLGDIVLHKSCDILGNMVVSFLDQRTIDLKQIKWEEIQAELEAEKTRLGAISITGRKYKIMYADTPEMHQELMGKTLGQRVCKEWKEDFIDEDSGEVVTIDRKEVVVSVRTVIDQEVLETIIEANPETITLMREV